MKIKKITKAIMILSVVAMSITIYLIAMHYAPYLNSTCSINETIDCDAVNNSKYSYLFHAIGLERLADALYFDLPLSIIGFFTYIILFVSSLLLYINLPFMPGYKNKKYITIIFTLSLIGFLFSLYLSYIEAFILHAWCVLCVMQAIIIAFIFFLSIALLRCKEFS